MYTYQMTIVNADDCKKNIYVEGETFLDAVKTMRREHGNGWSVYSYKIVSAGL